MTANPNPADVDPESLQFEVDWSTDAIVARRNKYFSASQRAFVPYKHPLIFKRGQDQYLWDEQGNKYLDCLSQNLTISVGYSNLVVTEAVQEQVPIETCYIFARRFASRRPTSSFSNTPLRKAFAVYDGMFT